MAEVRLTGVNKFYGAAQALHSVSLTIADGEFAVFVGPSGCGKSTLLRSIAGLEEISGGTIHIGDRDVTRAAPSERDVAMVFQSYALYPHMTVAENMGFPLEMQGLAKDEIARRVRATAQTLQLQDHLDRKPRALSGGQRQQVAVGRALMTQPSVLMLDEPTAGVSPIVMDELFDRIIEVARTGISILMVEQNARQALEIADKGYVLVQGANRFTDTGKALLADPEVRRTFLGG